MRRLSAPRALLNAEFLRNSRLAGTFMRDNQDTKTFRMKIRSLLFTLSLAACLAPLAGAQQQQQPSAAAATAQDSYRRHGSGRGDRRARREQRLAMLTADERAKLKAAHRAAMQDPAVQAAKAQRDENRRAFRQTLRAAMLKADPSVGPVLDKLRAARGGRGGHAMRERLHRRLAALDETERAKLRAAHEGVKDDPAVAAARTQMERAATPEDRRQAHRLMAEAMRNAMLRNDPTVGPILEKMRQADDGSSL